MGSKHPIDYSYLNPCESRNKGCPFVSDNCAHEKCGFYYRVNADFKISDTIEELRLINVSEKDIRSLMDISNSAEFRRQAFFRFYRPI